MENPTVSTEHKRFDVSIPKDQASLRLVHVLLYISLCVVVGISGFFLGSQRSVNAELSSSTEKVAPTNETLYETENPEVRLPFPIARRQATSTPVTWKSYKDQSGYRFSYPTSWFVTDGASQVQNWDPNALDLRPVPLSGGQTKWDLSFQEQPFTSLNDLIAVYGESIDQWDMFEVSSTVNGWPVLFMMKEKAEPMGSPYLVAMILTPEQKVITWHGFFGDVKSSQIELLKQVAESLQK